MPRLTEEDLIGPVEEAAELQSMLGGDLTPRDQLITPPEQPPLAFGVAEFTSQTGEGVPETYVTSTTSAPSANHDADQAPEQPLEDAATTPNSSTSTSQHQDPTTGTSIATSITTSTPSTPSTPKRSKASKRKSTTTTSSPRPRSAAKRKSRNFEDDDDEYRAPSTPRSKARRSRVVAKADDDEEYGPARFVTRTMTRKITRGSRYGSRSSDPDPDQEDPADEISLCLADCQRAEDDEMLECAGGCEKKFHAPCVGFRSVLPVGRRWLCFECRKEKQLGMRSNGIVAEGEEGELVEVAAGSKMEIEWKRDGRMV